MQLALCLFVAIVYARSTRSDWDDDDDDDAGSDSHSRRRADKSDVKCRKDQDDDWTIMAEEGRGVYQKLPLADA